MILVLTYHKVMPEHAADQDFYTVTPETLEQQLDAVLASGVRPLAPPELLQPGTPSGFLLTFDDATSDHVEIVVPLLHRRKLTGTFFVPTAKLGQQGYLQESDVIFLRKSGHEVGCHSHEHRRMDRMSQEEAQGQLKTSRDILRRLTGAAPVYFAPPGGFTSATLIRSALGCGLKITRTMRWGLNAQVDLSQLECVPVNRHMGPREFEKAIRGQKPKLVYTAKEAIKRVVPAKAYEALRRAYFRFQKK